MAKLQEKKIPKFQTSGKFAPYPNLDLDQYLKLKITPDSVPGLIPTSKLKFNTNVYDPVASSHPQFPKSIVEDIKYFNANDNLPKGFGINKALKDINAGKEETEEDQKTKDLLATTYGVKDPNYSGLIKPGISGLSALFNLSALKKTRDEALKRTSPRVDAAIAMNRPIQGLPPEIVNLYLKNMGALNFKKTSDAVANIVGNQMLNEKKMTALDKLATMQSKNLSEERARYDKTATANALNAVKARNEMAKFAVDAYNKKTEIKSAYEKSKQDYTNKWIEEALVKPLNKRIDYNLTSAALTDSKKWSRLQDQIVGRQNQLKLDPLNKSARIALDELLKEQKIFRSTQLPKTYGETSKWIFKQ